MFYKTKITIKKKYKKLCLFLAESNLSELLNQSLDGRTVLKFQKERMTFPIVTIPIILLSAFILRNFQITLIAIAIAVVSYYYPIYVLKNKVSNSALKNDILFPNYVKILITLLKTNTVYNAFAESMVYVNPHMQHLIKQLLIEIDQDTSIEPYLKFANHFHSMNAMNIMTLIYYYNEESGNLAYLETITATNEKLKNNQIKELIQKKSSKLDKYSSFVFMLNILQVGAFIGFILFGAYSILLDF